jgi:UDP-3-O-[3-hydroxymyristoyl] glucosamine N-acyltransferase
MLIEKSCSELAALVGGTLKGNCPHGLTGVASLTEALETDVSFLGNEKYIEQVLPSRAGVVLVPESYGEPVPDGRAWIVCADPSKAFSSVVALFTPPPVTYPAGIDKTAVVHETAVIGEGVHVGACAVIGAGAVVGAHSVIGAGCFIGEKAKIGEDCLLYPRVVVRERCLLGNRVILHPGVVIGADGFGYNSGPQGHEKVPQVGIVQLDDDVEIGANSCVDRARFGRTWIQRGTKVDNLVQIGHNVQIGACSLIVAQAGISGSTILGNGVILAGQAGTAGHLRLGDGAIVMAQAGISKDIAPGKIMFGTPAVERKEFAKQMLNIARIEKLNTTVKTLVKQVAELQEALAKAQEGGTENT